MTILKRRRLFSPAVHCGIVGGGGGDAAETTAFLSYVAGNGTTLDATHINAYKALINGLVSDGIFAKLDGLHVTATQDLATARLNIIAPGTFDLANVNPVDPPTFVADRGISIGLGEPQSTQYTPSTSGGKYALNSATIMVWSNTTGDTSGGEFGTVVGSQSCFLTNSSVTGTQSWVNQSGGSGSTENISNGAGMYLSSRTASNNVNNYWGASGTLTTLSSSSAASTSLPTSALRVIGVDGYSNTNKQVSADAWGEALTGTDVANLYSLLQSYMTAVGN